MSVAFAGAQVIQIGAFMQSITKGVGEVVVFVVLT